MSKAVVEIGERESTIKGKESEEYIQRVVEYVNQMMDTLGEHTQTMAQMDIALLTAVNLTDELFKAQAALKQTQGELARLKQAFAKEQKVLADNGRMKEQN